MRAIEQSWAEFLDTDYTPLAEVRLFTDCIVWSAEHDGPLLIVEDGLNKRVAVYAFRDAEERERAIERVRRMPDGGGQAGAGFFAPVSPQPPARSPGNAEPPPGSDEVGG